MERFVFGILLIFSTSLFTQTTFNHRFNFGYPAAVMTNIVPTDSCYYATAVIADSLPPFKKGTLFLKFDLEGNLVFNNPLKSPDKIYEVWSNEIVPLDNGNFACAGTKVFENIRTTLLIIFNNEGDTIMTKEYVHPLTPIYNDLANIDFLMTSDSSFVFCNIVRVNDDTPDDVDYHIIKTDINSNILWENIYGNIKWDLPRSIIYDSLNNEIIVGGLKTNNNDAVENYQYQNHIFRLDSMGNVVWTYSSPFSEDLKGGARDMVVLEDGSLVVASGIGYEQERTSVNVVYYEKAVFKINYDKEVLWEREFKDKEVTSHAKLSQILKLEDNSGFIIAGESAEDLPQAGSTFETRGWITKISNEGDSLWTREYVGLDNLFNEQIVQDIKQTPDGGFILCGESKNWEDDDPIPQQAWLLKLDEHGCLVPGCNTIDKVIEKDNFQFELKLFPNPASDFLNVFFRDHSNFREYQFSIYDNLGRLVQEFDYSVTESTLMISLADYASGMYFLNLSAEGTVLKTEKFFVKK